MKIIPIEKDEFKEIYDNMRLSFPEEEIRTREDALSVLDDPHYTVCHTVAEGRNVGFITLWKLENFVFIEHFVTYGDYRGRGFGGEILKLLSKKFPKIVLECEYPLTPIAERRMNFYKRHGFKENTQAYFQPSYRGGEDVPLVLMSYPAELSDFEGAVKELYNTVYSQGRKENNDV